MPKHPILRGDGSGMLYNAYRSPLMLRSAFFGGMLTLPTPMSPPHSLTSNAKGYLATAKEKEATTDVTALELPAQFTAAEIEKFLDFIFLQGWSRTVPDLNSACAILKISHFFAVNTDIDFARYHLDHHPTLGPVFRLKMGVGCRIKEWISMGFDELMAVPINNISAEDESIMGWATYRALARQSSGCRAGLPSVRLTLLLQIHTPNHCNWCTSHSYCAGEWERMWMSTSGVFGALVKEELAGAEILEMLDLYTVGGMNTECHRRTCEGLKGPSSILRGEEALIDQAIAELLKQQGIA
ncbi:hypothetical protein B0H14DRAFT_2993853 [Mycena olivaceomarginata]|nr:hypothetical protein B0H14DRAFT_2993853 [Mycena olivaceomarginata]